MERPPAFTNLRIILQIFGFLIALEGFAEYFADRHYTDLFHTVIRLYFYYTRGFEHDPARPHLPESWEDWYNS
jgi:hypothetical protein